MNNKFLLSGGITRTFGNFLGDGHGSKFGELAILDWDNKNIESLIRYESSKAVSAEVLPSVYFTSATLIDDRLYLCSTTQVFVYAYPSLELKLEINHPWFNDVHHVTCINEVIYVASTGIDAVLGFDFDGELVSSQHVSNDDLWFRRSPDEDYRKIASTKPHDNHPNFIFELDGQVWVTRFEQKDAVNLANREETINLGDERVHDGHLIGDYIYFTSVNGHIIKVDAKDKQVVADYDLNAMDTRGVPLGWCRGVHIEGDVAYIAFSKLRSTKIEDNLRWLKRTIKKGSSSVEALPARIAKFDLARGQLLEEFIIPQEHMSIIFSVLKI
jgi:hypothetical protein